MTHERHLECDESSFITISDETLQGAPGWALKLIHNQQLMLRTLQEMSDRLERLERRVFPSP